jgi:hypothetical protein
VGSSQLGTKWETHVSDLFSALDDLFAAGEAVQDLRAHPGWSLLVRLLDSEAATVNRGLDGRLLESRAEYAHAHGRMGGLKAMEAAADAIVRKATAELDKQRAKHEQPARERAEV